MSTARIVIDDILVIVDQRATCGEVQVIIVGCALDVAIVGYAFVIAIHVLRITHILRGPLTLILSNKIVYPFILSISGGCYPTL